MRPRGRTIRPRQRHLQQKETPANGTALSQLLSEASLQPIANTDPQTPHGSLPKARSTPKTSLFVNDLDLLLDYLPGKSIDRHVHPITLFTIDDKAVPKTCSIRRIPPGLRDQVDH